MIKGLSRALNASASFVAERYYQTARENEGERLVGNINIVGSNRFREEVSDSLRKLQNYYPFGYALVQRYLRGIVALNQRLEFGFVIAVCFEQVASTGGLRWHPDRFAGILLRTATYTRLTQNYNICVWRNPKAQLPALRRELRWLRMISCDPAYVAQQQEFIELKARRVIC